jgi:NAD-dependent dihydropyrimidine dehydrogenase PreA subunit
MMRVMRCFLGIRYDEARIDRVSGFRFFRGGKRTMYVVTVDKAKCDGKGECVDACPVSVFEMKDGKSEPVSMDECLGCESCVEVCPTGAITVKES